MPLMGNNLYKPVHRQLHPVLWLFLQMTSSSSQHNQFNLAHVQAHEVVRFTKMLKETGIFQCQLIENSLEDDETTVTMSKETEKKVYTLEKLQFQQLSAHYEKLQHTVSLNSILRLTTQERLG